VVSLEFEDIPGVSRGTVVQAGAYGSNVEATPEVDVEYKIALEFLTDLAQKAGLKVE
jgi:hypothetical protein